METGKAAGAAVVPPQGQELAKRYDLVVIGTGMGGLTVAALMTAMRGKRVLAVERHFQAGGYMHSFERHGFRWDAGLHYVGQMAPGAPMRRVMDRVTAGRVDWNRLPEPFESFRYPGLRFDLQGGREAFLESYGQRFPSERQALRRYLKDVSTASMAFMMEMVGRNGSRVARVAARVGRFALGALPAGRQGLTTGSYLASRFRSPELRALLASQWGTYGLPPGQSPFGLHALIVSHYLEGGWYPQGGSSAVVDAVVTTIAAQGGQVLTGHEVEEIVVRDGRAQGVLIRRRGAGQSERFEVVCPVVVSDAGVVNTYLRLLSPEARVPFRRELESHVAASEPAVAVCLHMGLGGDPRSLGLSGGNVWMYDRLDHDATHAARGGWIGEGAPPQLFLSFPSARDPAARRATAEAMSYADVASFEAWKGTDWRRRGPEYEALKARLADDMLAAVERECPGFSRLVEYREVSTPLTNESLTGHDRGAMYGLPLEIAGGWRNPRSPRSPIPGLYLTGADVGSLGVVGAMMGGVTTVSALPDGISTPEVMR